ncbi:hypothetical protein CEXT_186861 [Caerostris extrusa]|uniref:Uncharacterized protein n=1 Tax=Caerostris extrusa TaxID=172846 RepID=A0AAV4X8E2_CAEEX|nr:hypothetical protein CEXT_186861 [Caerostris extrusa]
MLLVRGLLVGAWHGNKPFPWRTRINPSQSERTGVIPNPGHPAESGAIRFNDLSSSLLFFRGTSVFTSEGDPRGEDEQVTGMVFVAPRLIGEVFSAQKTWCTGI